jgi:hypothetical protein
MAQIVNFAFSTFLNEVTMLNDCETEKKDLTNESNICIEICKLQLDKFKQSRSIEFKVNIQFWIFLGISISYMLNSADFYFVSVCSIIIYYLVGIGLTILHFYWMKLIQESEDKDINKYFYYRNLAENVVKNSFRISTELQNQNSKPFKLRLKWIIVEVGFTGLIIIIGGLLLTSRTKFPLILTVSLLLMYIILLVIFYSNETSMENKK